MWLTVSQCGGVDLATMGHFEREGSQTYEKVIEGLRGLGKTPSFYTPKRKVIVNGQIPMSTVHSGVLTNLDETSSADAVILAVTPTKDTGRPLCQEDINQIQRSASLFKDNKAIILVNKMYDVIRASQYICAQFPQGFARLV